ncbi:hypothetical protein [Parapedobacter lycopersici]|uniref:hypothetical protein n=1 Tax=Parapedobacter lycopersici TaxID=1864939 RepID=UPI003341066F
MKTTNTLFRTILLVFIAAFTLTACSPDDGIDGLDGIDGINGVDGKNGINGKDGVNGKNGVNGKDGARGPAGPVGPRGPAGADGEDGQDGAQGPAGPRGPAGPAGAEGPAGKDGNANVFSSSWNSISYTVPIPPYPSGLLNIVKDTVIDNSQYSIGAIPAREFTPARLANSVVMVYMRFGSSPSFNLPYLSAAGGKVSTINFYTQPYALRLTRFTHDNSNTVKLNYSLQFKYIIIPKGLVANAQSNGVNLNDLAQTAAYFKLADQ